MSYTKSMLEIEHALLIKIPLKESFVVVSLSSLLNPYTTRRKRKQERGHSWWIPLSELKNGESDPLVKIAKVKKQVHAITQATKCRLNPKWMRMSRRKRKLNLLKGLDSSTLAIMAFNFFFIECSPSWETQPPREFGACCRASWFYRLDPLVKSTVGVG